MLTENKIYFGLTPISEFAEHLRDGAWRILTADVNRAMPPSPPMPPQATHSPHTAILVKTWFLLSRPVERTYSHAQTGSAKYMNKYDYSEMPLREARSFIKEKRSQRSTCLVCFRAVIQEFSEPKTQWNQFVLEKCGKVVFTRAFTPHECSFPKDHQTFMEYLTHGELSFFSEALLAEDPDM